MATSEDAIAPNPPRDEEDYNTFLYKFEQQIIDAWRPVPYTRNNVILYTVLTIICVTIGLVLVLTAPRTPEIELQYNDSTQGDGNTISMNFTLSQVLAQPVYLYYGLTQYYQNHRRYIKLFSTDQMNGNEVGLDTAKSQCGGNSATNQDVSGGLVTTSITGAALNMSDVAFPCGQRAKTFLQVKPEIDTMVIKYANGTAVPSTKTGIAWPDDKRAYKNSGNTAKQIIDNQDESWLVWYRPAAKNYFFKLHSIIQTDLPAGNYTFQVQDKYNAAFGEKWFHLGKSNYMGNRDYFLGIAFLVLGAGCLIVLIVFIAKCVTQMRSSPSKAD